MCCGGWGPGPLGRTRQGLLGGILCCLVRRVNGPTCRLRRLMRRRSGVLLLLACVLQCRLSQDRQDVTPCGQEQHWGGEVEEREIGQARKKLTTGVQQGFNKTSFEMTATNKELPAQRLIKRWLETKQPRDSKMDGLCVYYDGPGTPSTACRVFHDE